MTSESEADSMLQHILSTPALLLAQSAPVSPAPQVGIGAMAMLLMFIIGSMWIGMLANRATRSSGFMQGFFLGNRGLGVWALALTATIQSGGTFMGFPSFVYSHGWIVALDRQLHGRPNYRLRHPRQTTRPTQPQNQRHYRSGPLPHAFQQPGTRSCLHTIHPLISLLPDVRPV